jgi:hypothetical protein
MKQWFAVVREWLDSARASAPAQRLEDLQASGQMQYLP